MLGVAVSFANLCLLDVFCAFGENLGNLELEPFKVNLNLFGAFGPVETVWNHFICLGVTSAIWRFWISA